MSIYDGKYAGEILRSQISTNKNDEDHNDVISPRFPDLEAENSAPIQVPIELLNSLKEKQQDLAKQETLSENSNQIFTNSEVSDNMFDFEGPADINQSNN